MDSGSDRREARRFAMNLPLAVQAAENAERELSVQMRDVSYRGLYFFAVAGFEAGRDLVFVITLPQGISQKGSVKIRCQGQILRVDPQQDGKVGVAAKIDRYEFVPAVAAA
jgi:hypothetical protein